MNRTILAFLIAPAFPAIWMSATDILSFFYFGYSYICSYVIGVPGFLLLRKFKIEFHWTYALSGFLGGIIIIILINVNYINSGIFLPALVFGGFGLIVALVFSLVRGSERIRSSK